MNIRALRSGLVVSWLVMSGGCAGLEGRPDFPTDALLPPDVKDMLAGVKFPATSVSPPPHCKDAIAADDGQTGSESITFARQRNNCIFSYIAFIDWQYNKFKAETFSSAGGTNATADIVILGLNAAGTAVGATATKTILSAIATGIGGTKNVISQDVLYSNSILAIISKMDADRNQQLSVILQRIQNAGLPPSPDGVDAGQVKTGAPTPVVKSATFTKKVTVATPKTTTTPASTTTTTVETTTPPTKPKPPTTESGVPETEPTFTPYSMHEAAVDLLTYYWAGTIPHALVSMQQVSGAQAIDCKAQVNNLKTTGTKSGSPAELDLSATTPSSPTTVLAAQPKAC